MTVRLLDQFGWIGLDLGAKRTGVARSRYGKIADSYGLITGSLTEQTQQLGQLIDAWGVTIVVVGCPLAAANDHPVRAVIASLAETLRHRPTVELVIQDEDLTTKEAERQLTQAGQRGRESDALAARLILQDYLDQNPIHEQ